MAALVVKVGMLVLKTLAKPLASRFQAYVMAHPVARGYAITASQKLHRMEVWITRAADGKYGKAFVGDMTEEKSLEMASKLASEGFVFGFGIFLVAFEYERQRRKDVLKKENEQKERQAMLDQATQERERLARENREQTFLIETLHSRVQVLEADVQQLVASAMSKRQQRSMWGGFFGPRAAAVGGS